MKRKSKSFGIRLWKYFILYAAVIFAVLWLLQTVFLQKLYVSMAISSLKKTAAKLAGQKDEEDFLTRIDEAALENSLLVFVMDENDEVLYSVDEYSTLYDVAQDGEETGSENTYSERESGSENIYSEGESGSGSAYSGGRNLDVKNPYRAESGTMNWEKGMLRNLPYSHGELTALLRASAEETLGYMTEDGTAYVYGVKLGSCKAFPGESLVLCISMPLGSVGAAADILRMQLLWVSLLSLALAFVLAYFIAQKFEKPISGLSEQAKKLSQGEFETIEKTGFCTELDELSAALNEASHALDRLEHSRRELLASVSHDLRTPLTMIRGYAEMVQEISWNDEEQRNQDLTIIMREADRLTALVNEILEYSAMQSAGAAIEMSEINLSEIVEKSIKQFEIFCRQQGYEIETVVAQEMYVNGDAAQLARVIYNFIDNAVNHTGENRRISIRLENLGEKARFAVRDYGQGIPENEIPYIWEKYYTSRNRKNKDTVSGLGLPIAKEILAAHHAEMGVECKEGCEFWFEINKVGTVGR